MARTGTIDGDKSKLSFMCGVCVVVVVLFFILKQDKRKIKVLNMHFSVIV